jgi:hypothetical protein
MLKPGSRFLVTFVFILTTACGSGPAGPTDNRYTGTWSGTTFQGSAITFTVSSDQKLTQLTVGYNFNGCTGSSSFSPNVTIGDNSVGAPVLDFDSGSSGASNRVIFHFLFTSRTDAHGFVTFTDLAGCGAATGTWTASRR